MDAACYVAMYINYNVEPCAQVDTGVKYKCIYICILSCYPPVYYLL